MAHQWLTLAPPVGVDRHGDYRCHADDAPALAHLEVRGVEPHIGPLAGERPVEELADPLVDILAQLRDRALGDAREPHGLHQFVHPARGDPADPRLLNDRHERLFRSPAWLEEAGKVRALPQLRHPQVQRAQTGIESALSIPVSVGRASLGALVAPGTDDALDVGLHDQLKHRLGDGAEEIAIVLLLKQLGEAHSGLGHRGFLR